MAMFEDPLVARGPEGPYNPEEDVLWDTCRWQTDPLLGDFESSDEVWAYDVDEKAVLRGVRSQT